MTTGNDTVDYRVTVSTPRGPVPNVGTYWSRIWNGGNAPAVTYAKPQYYSEGGVRKVWNRPPKRGRNRGEHAYTMSLVSLYNPLCSFTYKFNDPPGVYYGSWEGMAGSISFKDTWTSNDDLALLGKLREAIMGTTFDAGVFLAEAGQAAGMITAAAGTLAKAYRDAKRGDFKSATAGLAGYEKSRGRSAFPRAVGKRWLGAQYGVRPLLNDVHDAAQTLAHFMSYPLQRTYTVTRKSKGTVSTGAPSAYGVSGEGFRAKKIKAVLREVNVISLIGLADPASVAWEKLPYSFVVDWFVPLGAYLQARGLSQSLTGTFVTTDTVKYWANGGFVIFKNSSFATFGGGGDYRRRFVSVNRSVSTTLSVPTPTIKPVGKAATWQHMANAVGLVTQHLR